MEESGVFDIINSIVSRNRRIAKLYLAEYHYVPRMLSPKGRLRIYEFDVDNGCDLNTIIKEMHESIRPNWQLGLISLVRLSNGEFRHMPQIDFVCRKSLQNQDMIKKRLREIVDIGQGWLVDSGNSYHFYGVSLLTHSGWLDFLGRCLVCNERDKTPLVDWRWIGYSLILGYTTLRILRSPLVKAEPKVIVQL